MRYHYKCYNTECNNEFFIHQSMKDDSLTFCENCKTDNLQRVLYAVQCSVEQEPKTLGALAERNSKAIGYRGMEEKWEQQDLQKKLAKKEAREQLAQKLPKGASLPNIYD